MDSGQSTNFSKKKYKVSPVENNRKNGRNSKKRQPRKIFGIVAGVPGICYTVIKYCLCKKGL